jgi:hypothetical protein
MISLSNLYKNDGKNGFGGENLLDLNDGNEIGHPAHKKIDF